MNYLLIRIAIQGSNKENATRTTTKKKEIYGGLEFSIGRISAAVV